MIKLVVRSLLTLSLGIFFVSCSTLSSSESALGAISNSNFSELSAVSRELIGLLTSQIPSLPDKNYSVHIVDKRDAKDENWEALFKDDNVSFSFTEMSDADVPEMWFGNESVLVSSSFWRQKATEALNAYVARGVISQSDIEGEPIINLLNVLLTARQSAFDAFLNSGNQESAIQALRSQRDTNEKIRKTLETIELFKKSH